MRVIQSPAEKVRFDVFEVDLRAGELHRDGRRIKLQEQPFRVLSLLLQRTGEVVTREELRERLWPVDTFVDFDHGLNSAVARLREALRDSAGETAVHRNDRQERLPIYWPDRSEQGFGKNVCRCRGSDL
jgi:DNA-binding winged helix-turn-helix (wHTH) protein